MRLAIWLELAMEIALLLLWNRLNINRPRGQKVVIFVISIYFFIGYILRSLVLLLINPIPRFGDSVADRRLFEFTNYDQQLFSIHLIVITGLVGALIGNIAYHFIVKNKKVRISLHPNPTLHMILLVAGIICVFLSEGIFRNPITITLSLIVIPSALLLLRDFQGTVSKKISRNLSVIGFALALFLSVIQSSKAPFFGFVVGFLLIMEKKIAFRFTIKNFFVYLALVSSGSFIFLWLQSIKSSGFLGVSRTIGYDYFGEWHGLYLIVQRFDLIKALTDAKFAENQTFLTPVSMLNFVFKGLQWNWNSKEQTFGQLWAANISSISDPGNLRSGTALSTGFIPEGWLIGGYLGTFIVSILFIFVTCFLTSNILRNETFFAFGITLICNNIFFERGLVGLAEGTALGSKVVAIFAVAGLVSRSAGRGNSSAPIMESRINPPREAGEP